MYDTKATAADAGWRASYFPAQKSSVGSGRRLVQK
jgi:hypothetical protein